MNAEKKIWADFRKGKSYALSHIYHKHVQLLFRYGKKFTKDDEIIKDTIQDLFFDLLRTRENLGETDSIKFYLIVSFRRKLIQNLKKQPLYNDTEIDNISISEISYSFEPELAENEGWTSREMMVQKGLKKLNPRQREIFFYRFTCDFSYEQICEIMSLKYDSARKLNFRALKLLKQYVT